MEHKQEFNAPVGHVAGADMHVHQYWPDTAPPDDPAKATQCWQCDRRTWRYTRHCMHCGLDLRPSAMGRLKTLVRELLAVGVR